MGSSYRWLMLWCTVPCRHRTPGFVEGAVNAGDARGGRHARSELNPSYSAPSDADPKRSYSMDLRPLGSN